MRTLTYQLRDLKKVNIEIGFEGENNRTQVRIDCGEVFAEYPNAEAAMKVQAPKGGIYPVTVTRDGDMILWTVRDCDVANKGNGEFQLTFTDGETVVKTCSGKFHVERSLKGSGTAPSGVQDWLERAEEVLEGVEAAEIHQPMIGLDGYWYKWDQEEQQYVSTGTKAQGQDGVGIASIVKTGTVGLVDTYTITFTNGTTTTYTVTNGEGRNVIDDTAPAADKTYSSNKVEAELTPVKNALQAFETVTFCDKKTANLVNGKMVRATNSNIGENWENCLENNSSSWYLENAIDLTGYIGKTIRLTTNGYAASSVRAMGFCDDDGKISSVTMEKDIAWTENNGSYYHDFIISDTHFFFSFSQQGTNTPWQITIFGQVDNFKSKVLETTYSKEQIDEKTQSGKTLYVSLSGNDSNPGTQAEPLATINKALELGANVVLLSNHTFKQQIDMSKLQSTTLEIAPIDPTFKPIIMEQSSTLATSETAVDGYTKVKKVTYSGTFATGNNTLFQHGVPDALTLISDAERHPLQRGKEYRCEDTAIKQCSADNVSDALTEIENANTNVFKFYHDKPNNTLYFSRPQTINSTNPLCFSRGNSAFTNIGRNITVKITGITFKYIICDIRYMVNPKLIDCAVMNVFGDGGFLYDQAVNAEFIRCEATRVYKSGNGDGFNAHSLTTGEAFAKQTTATLIDCWAHDNNDDGWSAHERSETTIIGGLYEYNTKGGITPSYGAHCTCHGVYARKCSYNFYFTGENTQAEGGKYGQLICYDCVAEANSYSQGAGFGVNGAGNKMILVNCKAIGNRYAYFANTNTIMDLIDCKSGSNVTAETNGTGTFNVKL